MEAFGLQLPQEFVNEMLQHGDNADEWSLRRFVGHHPPRTLSLKYLAIVVGRKSCSPNVPPPDVANHLRWPHDATIILFRLFYLLYVQVKDKTSVITVVMLFYP